MIENFFHRIGWLLVIVGGAAISNWSLYSLARGGHLPIAVAVFVGMFIDGLTFVSSVQALKWNRIPNASGFSARIAMLSAAGLSSWLNYEHGSLIGSPMPVKVILAFSSIAGVWAMENHLRFTHRATLHKNPVPKPELGMWLLFPVKAFKLLRLAYSSRMHELAENQLPVANAKLYASNAEIRTWLRQNGYNPGFAGRLSNEHIAIYSRAMANGHAELTEGD